MQARTEEYARLLRRFSAEELEEAYTDVLEVWDHPTWPPPGRLFTAAMENRKDRDVREHPQIPHLPSKQLDLPHGRVMAALDACPGLSDDMRQALYRLGTGGQQPPWANTLKRGPGGLSNNAEGGRDAAEKTGE